MNIRALLENRDLHTLVTVYPIPRKFLVRLAVKCTRSIWRRQKNGVFKKALDMAERYGKGKFVDQQKMQDLAVKANDAYLGGDDEYGSFINSAVQLCCTLTADAACENQYTSWMSDYREAVSGVVFAASNVGEVEDFQLYLEIFITMVEEEMSELERILIFA